jgi:hypothetical protein
MWLPYALRRWGLFDSTLNSRGLNRKSTQPADFPSAHQRLPSATRTAYDPACTPDLPIDYVRYRTDWLRFAG